MAVYELNDGQLLRVARSIGGKLEQQYFSLAGLSKAQVRVAYQQANALDEKWAQLQQDARNTRVKAATTTRQHSTGVRGINLVRRPSVAFRVQVQIEGQSHVREFSVRRLGAEKAWSEATKYLAGIRGYKSTPKEWRVRMPKIKGAL